MFKGIGKNYLTAKKIQEHIVNPLLGYLYHDIKKQELKMKPLPRYYKELIFNPNQLDENGKIIYRENGQPLKKPVNWPASLVLINNKPGKKAVNSLG